MLKTSADVTVWTADPVSGTATATETKGSDIASAATTDIGASSGQYVEVTGTTTITALGTTVAGVRRVVRFVGALTLTYNATSLILPGNANIATVAGDVGTFISLGSGNWVCVDYLRDTGRAVVGNAKGADVANAATLTLGTDGDYFDITGTTTITAIATLGVGTAVRLHFDGALTLTHHSTNLVLPGSANIVTVAGDEATFVEYASGDWRCTSYLSLAATQAEMEAATSNTVHATPERLKFHPGVAKVWVQVSYSGGVPQDDASLNVSSLDDDGTGKVGINLTTAFSSANYHCVGGLTESTGSNSGTKAYIVGASEIQLWIYDSTTLKDIAGSAIAFGDQ